jgi:hypothetical protein
MDKTAEQNDYGVLTIYTRKLKNNHLTMAFYTVLITVHTSQPII